VNAAVWLLALLTLQVTSPARLKVTAANGAVAQIALMVRPGTGPLVPLGPLAHAINGKVRRDHDWTALDTPAGNFRFLAGTPLVDLGGEVRGLPAPTVLRGDSLFVPLAFVAEVLADPAREAWNWTPATAVLAEGPGLPPLARRPSRTTVGQDDRSRLPGGLQAGHHVTIDPGHGGTDPGNPGLFFPNGLKEKDVTLAVGLLVRNELERRGVKVTMTRTTDTLINLAERAPRYCSKPCDLFVSLHVNSLDPRPGFNDVRGFETYFLATARTTDAARVARTENSAIRYDLPKTHADAGGLDFIMKDLQTNEFLRQSARAATLVQSHLDEVQSGGPQGVKQAEFAVLTTARAPAILVEMGYATNRDDARLMTTPDGQRALAGAIADAVVGYLREVDHERCASDTESACGN
jgi:N-acetylmuramoyl-L-alanine amidase